MKQKYTIHKDTTNRRLVIKEYAELDKEMLSLLCEETYEDDQILTAIQAGREKLIRVLRTRNMYPPSAFIGKIASAVVSLYEAVDDESKEVMFDDKELFENEEPDDEPEASVNADSDDIDGLLEDDIDDVYEDKKLIKDLKSSLKVADDESVDTDDEP